jgi:toxin ParE1/3/4
MELRWTEEAANDLECIADYLFEHAQAHADELVRQIFEAPSVLLRFPHRGRPGKKEGARELVLPAAPYIIVYRIAGGAIHIVRILHGAQKWP